MTNPAPPTTDCPLPAMTAGEIFRYLDGGYPAGVQSALSRHVDGCDRCHAAAERAERLRGSGHATLLAALDDPASPSGPDPDQPPARPDESAHVSAMAMARFVDGTAPDPEQAAITEHLVECPQCYRQFAGMTDELNAPPKGFSAPNVALNRVKAAPSPERAAERPARPAETPALDRRPGLIERIQSAIDELLVPRWAIGLGGAVAGMLLAVLLVGTPPDRVVVPLGAGQAAVGGRVMSGMDATPPAPATTLPTPTPAFTWTAVPNATAYTLTLTNQGGDEVIKTSVEETEWTVPPGTLQSGTPYTLVVTADLENGAVVPLERLQFEIKTSSK